MLDNPELLRTIVLSIGWPTLLIGGAYIYFRAIRFYLAVNSTPVARLVPVFAFGTIITMMSLGMISTSFLMINVKAALLFVLPVFIIWFVLMVITLIASFKMDKEGIEHNKMITELDRAKSDFIAMSSHQLRTPLTGIRWIVELLLNKEIVRADQSIKDKLESIELSTDKMLTLISNLLETVRLETGKVQIHRVELNIKTEIGSLVKMLEPNYQKNNQSINIQSNLTEDSLKIMSDKTLLGEILKNIISNAINYGDKNSEIKISVAEISKSKGLEVRINNQGKVISKERISKIFERYSRVESKEVVQEIGGLGLYLAKHFADMINIKIDVESNEVEGTTFILIL